MKRKTIGARRLREALEKQKIAQMAVNLDCSVTTICNLLSGGHPSLKIALAAQRLYGIEPDEWGPFAERGKADQ
jgi:hypothetical protein